MKKLLLILGVGFVFICVLVFRPVPITSEDKCLSVEGIVKAIYEGGVKDVVFVLEDNQTRYYINRGLEQGLSLDKLKNDLIGQEIVIKYPKYWTPLDPKESTRHLSKLKWGNQVIFDETI